MFPTRSILLILRFTSGISKILVNRILLVLEAQNLTKSAHWLGTIRSLTYWQHLAALGTLLCGTLEASERSSRWHMAAIQVALRPAAGAVE
jgi:hypothetical protein